MALVPLLLVPMLVILVASGCAAQRGGDVLYRKDAPERLNRQYIDAYSMYINRSFQQAIRECDRMIRRNSNFIDAYLLRGDIYLQTGNHHEAARDFEAAIKLDPDYKPGIYFTLGKIRFQQQMYTEAYRFLEAFLSYSNFSDKLREEAEVLMNNSLFIPEALRNPVPFELVDLGPGVNTNMPEYLPSLTIDGQTLIFTRRLPGREDFYVSHFEDGEWQLAYNLGPPVNTANNEGAQSISADGKTLVYTVCNRPEGFGSCDLMISYLRQGSWTEPEFLPPPVNTQYWESQPSLSAAGNTLYFTSNRPGSIGGKDIWVSHKQADGSWTEPVNLGDVINTKFDEQSPFIHPDGETLYFASTGHPGMGNEDIYLSRLSADGQWTEPVNLGYPINTSGRENSLIVSADGATAYFATNRHSRNPNNLNIYKFELPEEVRPIPVTWVEGTVTNIYGESIEAAIEVYRIDRPDRKELITAYEGEYLICIPVGHTYGFNVDHTGYLFYSEHFDVMPGHDISSPYRVDIVLRSVAPAETGTEVPTAEPVVLRNVFFATGSFQLRPESGTELDRLIRLLNTYETMHIAIHGHTDNVGDDAMNMDLSRNRARSVYEYLIAGGIDAGRLEYDGFGPHRPIAANDTEEGRQLNRRTEFVVTSQ